MAKVSYQRVKNSLKDLKDLSSNPSFPYWKGRCCNGEGEMIGNHGKLLNSIRKKRNRTKISATFADNEKKNVNSENEKSETESLRSVAPRNSENEKVLDDKGDSKIIDASCKTSDFSTDQHFLDIKPESKAEKVTSVPCSPTTNDGRPPFPKYHIDGVSSVKNQQKSSIIGRTNELDQIEKPRWYNPSLRNSRSTGRKFDYDAQPSNCNSTPLRRTPHTSQPFRIGRKQGLTNLIRNETSNREGDIGTVIQESQVQQTSSFVASTNYSKQDNRNAEEKLGIIHTTGSLHKNSRKRCKAGICPSLLAKKKSSGKYKVGRKASNNPPSKRRLREENEEDSPSVVSILKRKTRRSNTNNHNPEEEFRSGDNPEVNTGKRNTYIKYSAESNNCLRKQKIQVEKEMNVGYKTIIKDVTEICKAISKCIQCSKEDLEIETVIKPDNTDPNEGLNKSDKKQEKSGNTYFRKNGKELLPEKSSKRVFGKVKALPHCGQRVPLQPGLTVMDIRGSSVGASYPKSKRLSGEVEATDSASSSKSKSGTPLGQSLRDSTDVKFVMTKRTNASSTEDPFAFVGYLKDIDGNVKPVTMNIKTYETKTTVIGHWTVKDTIEDFNQDAPVSHQNEKDEKRAPNPYAIQCKCRSLKTVPDSQT